MNNPFNVLENESACVLSDADVTTLCYLLRIARYDNFHNEALARKIYERLDSICWLSHEF